MKPLNPIPSLVARLRWMLVLALAPIISATAAPVEGAIKAGWFQGVRAVDLIRAGILSVTLDASLADETLALPVGQFRDANWRLDVTPGQTGRLPQDQVDALTELRRALGHCAKK